MRSSIAISRLRIFAQAQEIGRHLLDLTVEQLGVWHSVGVVQAPMNRRKEALHPIRVDVPSLRYRFEGRCRRLQNGLKWLAARRHMAIGANQDRQFSPFPNVVCTTALLAPAWATG